MTPPQGDGKFHGKFRGKVLNNIDLERRGRLTTLVPAVSEFPLSWALPCAPMAGKGVGMFTMPPIGANVWVEFEGGNPNFPIWTGGFWAKNETPGTGLPTTHVWKTLLSTITLEDLGQSLSMEFKAGPGVWSIQVDPSGVSIRTGTVSTVVQPTKVRLEVPGAFAELAEASVTIDSSGAATLTVKPTEISAVQAASSMTVGSGTARIASGQASVALAGKMVQVNDDGLVVM